MMSAKTGKTILAMASISIRQNVKPPAGGSSIQSKNQFIQVSSSWQPLPFRRSGYLPQHRHAIRPPLRQRQHPTTTEIPPSGRLPIAGVDKESMRPASIMPSKSLFSYLSGAAVVDVTRVMTDDKEAASSMRNKAGRYFRHQWRLIWIRSSRFSRFSSATQAIFPASYHISTGPVLPIASPGRL